MYGLEQTFYAIGQHCSHLHLKDLKVQPKYPHCHSSFIEAAALKPLLAFRNLSSLYLELKNPFRIGNQAVREMVSAWPQHTSLIIGVQGWSEASSITPAGLVHLLHLPHLHTLSFTMDASKVDVDFISDSANALPNNTVIRSLDLQNSIINDVEAMTMLLSIVTPNVQNILAYPHQDRWSEVMVLVRESRFSEESVG